MAIRMKEWGLRPNPSSGVQIPLSGVNGMTEGAHAFGQGLRALASAGEDFAEMYDKVEERGELSRLSGALEEAAAGARERLCGSPAVENWESAWRQETAAAVDKALEEVSASRRDEARAFADSLMQRASLDAQRRYEVQRITGLRRDWQKRVEDAAQQGDMPQALARLEEGRDVFVPESEMEKRRAAVESRCRLGAWQQRLQETPMAALEAWQSGTEALPSVAEDVAELQQQMARAHRSLRSELGAGCARRVLQGEEPDAAALQAAARAGILTLPQEDAPVRALSVQEETAWMRRADAAADEDDALAEMRLQLAVAKVPQEQRRRLLRYVEESRSLPAAERRRMGNAVWNLYLNGRLGCVGDALAQRRAARLMEESHRRLASGKEAETLDWLSSLSRPRTAWVCYEPQAD